ncbi:hypothetical protein D3C76_739070 [compost metagenome]
MFIFGQHMHVSSGRVVQRQQTGKVAGAQHDRNNGGRCASQACREQVDDQLALRRCRFALNRLYPDAADDQPDNHEVGDSHQCHRETRGPRNGFFRPLGFHRIQRCGLDTEERCQRDHHSNAQARRRYCINRYRLNWESREAFIHDNGDAQQKQHEEL